LKQGPAFDLFTRRLGEWWPLASNSLALKHAASCHLEARPGGRIFERTAEGAESVWGTIVEWVEPERFAASWHPGRHPDSAQVLAVRFVAVGGQTRVELEQRDWEQAGHRAEELRERNEDGWPGVLARYELLANRKP
jgi:hypothetical protein